MQGSLMVVEDTLLLTKILAIHDRVTHTNFPPWAVLGYPPTTALCNK